MQAAPSRAAGLKPHSNSIKRASGQKEIVVEYRKGLSAPQHSLGSRFWQSPLYQQQCLIIKQMGWKITLWYRWAEKRSIFLTQGTGCSFAEFFQRAVLSGAHLTAWGKRVCLSVPNVHVPRKAYVAVTKCSTPPLHPSRWWHKRGSRLPHGVTSWGWGILTVKAIPHQRFCLLFFG